MIKISFKNVGQGDSIIIEWKKDGVPKIAIIDCNIYQNGNPVLKYIIDNNYSEIEYLILSHPHYDHFSGFHQLLQYCKEANIKINYFLHTSTIPTFFRMAVKTITAENEIQKLLDFLHNNFEEMNFKFGTISADTPKNIPLNDSYSITILSPSQKELNNYIKGAKYPFDEESPHDNPLANWLSTVLKINTQQGYILLTSDTDKSSLIRIDKKMPEEIDNELLLGQSPHHGAKTNHNNAFWKKRKRENNTPIVFSVGANNYKHPSTEAVDFFRSKDYKLYATNKVGGLIGDINKDIPIALDMFSSVSTVLSDDLHGDKVFNY